MASWRLCVAAVEAGPGGGRGHVQLHGWQLAAGQGGAIPQG